MTLYALKHAPLFAALIGGLVLFSTTAGATELADGEGSGEASRRLVGTWLHQFTFTDCDTGAPLRAAFPVLNTYFRDGSHTDVTSGRSPALRTVSQGQWRRIGARTFVNRYEFFLFDEAGTYAERAVYQRTIELSADGKTLTASSKYSRYTPDGVVTFTGCVSEEGERMPAPERP